MKLKILFATIAVMFLISVSSALAAVWDVTGDWEINVEYLGTDYLEKLILTQVGDQITGVSINTIPPSGGSAFTVTSGSVIGDTVNIMLDHDVSSLMVHMEGTIDSNGKMSGTWHDEAPGTRSGTWETVTGAATNLDIDDDGVLNNDDYCSGTVADVPTKALGTNRWKWNGASWETKLPKGEGPQKSFTMEDTRGCSCQQILGTMDGKMSGHWKFGCSISVMEDFIAGLPPVLVDTVQVYANDPNPTSSNIVLESGVQYELEAVGTVFAGDTIDFDAKYSLTNRISGDTWTDSVSGYESFGPTLLDLKVGGNFVDWGAYSDVHTYYYTVTGTGAALDLLIYDIFYPNNSGYITVNIYELP